MAIDNNALQVSPAPVKVLVFEDELDLRSLMVNFLADEGFEARGLSDANQALSEVAAFLPKIILVDQMMPGKTGLELIREIRTHINFCTTPIVMVSGLDSEQEKVTALELGADDYITKPFLNRELIARVRAILRRSDNSYSKSQSSLCLGPLEVDFRTHKALLNGEQIPLTLTEFNILAELIKQSGGVLSREQLREQALGNFSVSDRTIDVHMASVRKKLKLFGDSIETVRGIGYRLNLS